MIGGYQALIVRNQTDVTAALLEAATGLKVVGRVGVGLDNIDVAAATRLGIVVANTPDQNSISVAELAIGLMLGLARRISAADRSTRAGAWQRHRFTGTELYGGTLGVVGLGRIGFLTASRARALGMDIVAYDPFISADAAPVTELRAEMLELDDVMRRADVISCHLPATDATRGCLDYRRFALMKPSALFVNTSRGDVVDEPGLVRALREGRPAGAALDVRAGEPPVRGALEEMEQVILTPHIAAFTHQAQHLLVSAVCDDVAAILTGGRARHGVDLDRPVSEK